MAAAITKIAWRVALLLAALSLLATAATLVGQSPGITFAFGSPSSPFNLRIDSKSTYNGTSVSSATWALKNLVPGVDKFFNLGDIKPGDEGEATISFHVNKDAWVCLDFENLKEAENGINEPEGLEDVDGVAGAELAEGTEFFAWYDDGDNLFEVGEQPIFGTSTQAASIVLNQKTYALADAIAGQPFLQNQTRYIGLQWCAGNMTVNVGAATIVCDGEALGNEAQTDSFAVDLSFRAVPKHDNPRFTCKKANTTCQWPGPVNINVNNNATIINNTSSSANTGGNTAGSGGTVTTSNATANSSTTNVVNTTVISTTSSSSGFLPNLLRSLLRSR